METSLVVALLMLLVLTIAIFVSWVKGKSAGAESQQLADALDHQEKILKAAMEQRALELKLKNEELKIRARADEPLTQAAVDKMLEKYKNLN